MGDPSIQIKISAGESIFWITSFRPCKSGVPPQVTLKLRLAKGTDSSRPNAPAKLALRRAGGRRIAARSARGELLIPLLPKEGLGVVDNPSSFKTNQNTDSSLPLRMTERYVLSS